MRGLFNEDEFGYGGHGNDWIQGSHSLSGVWAVSGGDGDDKILGGDYVKTRIEVNGNDGNDIIKGGDNSPESDERH